MGRPSVAGPALKYLGNQEGESVHVTASEHLRKVAMQRILEATSRQAAGSYLETGSSAAFAPARNLYSAFGFRYCGPFGAYSGSNSSFMTLSLNDK
jgi:putative acetyltransferase